MNFIGQVSDMMNYSMKEREVASHNITNQSTPGFKAQQVVPTVADEEAFEALFTTDEKHIGGKNGAGDEPTYGIEDNPHTKVRTDGNNVDVTKEMIGLMETNQQYNLAIEGLNSFYGSRVAARGQ